jgi:hypothetical protein
VAVHITCPSCGRVNIISAERDDVHIELADKSSRITYCRSWDKGWNERHIQIKVAIVLGGKSIFFSGHVTSLRFWIPGFL